MARGLIRLRFPASVTAESFSLPLTSAGSAKKEKNTPNGETILKFLVLLGILGFFGFAGRASGQEWRYYGGDAGGMRFSPLTQINRENVSRLIRAWTYHTGEIEREGNATDRHRIAPFESTPLVIDGTLYFSTPSSRVIALNADTGAEIWKFDPQATSGKPRQYYQHRGVSYWRNKDGQDQRILYGSFDGRLIALDARTGKPCTDFGNGGTLVLKEIDRGLCIPLHLRRQFIKTW